MGGWGKSPAHFRLQVGKIWGNRIKKQEMLGFWVIFWEFPPTNGSFVSTLLQPTILLPTGKHWEFSLPLIYPSLHHWQGNGKKPAKQESKKKEEATVTTGFGKASAGNILQLLLDNGATGIPIVDGEVDLGGCATPEQKSAGSPANSPFTPSRLISTPGQRENLQKLMKERSMSQ
jgi:hypothetical protein